MPIYDYQCTHCNHELELIQKISDSPATLCPECAKETLVKRVSAPSFRLSGSGWYETDFKEGKKKNVVTKEKTSAPSSASPDKCATK